MHYKVFKGAIPYLLIATIALFLFSGIFKPGFMSGYDNSFHYYDAYYLTRTLIPQHHWISGWSMQGMAGMPIFVDYYQTGFLLIAVLNKIFHIPLNLSYKIMVLTSYISLGTGFYKISSYRFGKIAALLIAMCLMLQKSIYYDKILVGMWSNYLALGIFFIFFHTLDKSVKNLTLRNAATLGLLLGLIILTHLFVAIFAFVIFLVYAVPNVVNMFKKKLGFKQSFLYASIPIWAFLVSSYYLYGFIVSRNYFSIFGYKDVFTGLVWSLKSFLGPLEESAALLSTSMLNIPVIIRIIFSFFGVFIFFRRKDDLSIKNFLTCTIIFIFISLIIFSDILSNIFSWWRSISFVGNLQTNRFVIYAQLGMYLFAAYGLYKFLECFRKKIFVAIMILILILISAVFHYRYVAYDATKTLDQSPQMADIHKLWSWIDKNISPEKGRIVYQNTVGNSDDPILKRSDVFALSGIFTKVPQIGVSRSASTFPQEKYMRNDQDRIFGKDINEASPEFVSDMMRYFNSGYIATVERRLKNKLQKSEPFLKKEDFGAFSIFYLKDFENRWIDFEKDARYETLHFNNQDVKFNIWNRASNNQAFVKIAYHPLWQAWLNKKPVKIKQDKYSLMEIDLPHEGYYQLELLFNSFNPFLATVSLLSFLISITIIIYNK